MTSSALHTYPLLLVLYRAPRSRTDFSARNCAIAPTQIKFVCIWVIWFVLCVILGLIYRILARLSSAVVQTQFPVFILRGFEEQ